MSSSNSHKESGSNNTAERAKRGTADTNSSPRIPNSHARIRSETPIVSSTHDDYDDYDETLSLPSVTTHQQHQQQQPKELRRPYEAQTPTKYRKPLQKGSGSPLTTTTPRRIHVSTVTAPTMSRLWGTPSTKTTPAAAAALPKTNGPTPQPQKQQETILNAVSTKEQEDDANSLEQQQQQQEQRDFQYACDLPSVSVRLVNVAQRSAFGLAKLPSLSEWQRLAANEFNTTSATTGTAKSTQSKKRRLSPSYRHLEIMHKLQAQQIAGIRQLQYSPSTGMDADYFHSLETVQGGGSTDYADRVLGVDRRRCRPPNPDRHPRNAATDPPDAVPRDGRYRSIDPVASTLALLNPGSIPPPSLSHKKVRLPNRADVGFPNASVEDVAQKQKEIRYESVWEETSPRIVLLVTSDDLGTEVVDESMTSKALSKQFGCGCEGLPYAGRPLAMAKEQNARMYNRDISNGNAKSLPSCLRPNPYSLLAPPLESTFSPSQGWRPRPFHDRPAGMRYCLAWPMAVTLEEGNHPNEALTCSLALYTLPPLYKEAPFLMSATAAAAYHCKKQGSKDPPVFGKISEEFWFPAGNWDDATCSHSNVEENMALLQSWMNHNQKAVFSYNPLDLVMERSKRVRDDVNRLPDSVYLVLQIFKFQRVPDVQEQAQSQILSPVAFGITKFFSASETVTNKQWPAGQRKEMTLYSHGDTMESQGSFVDRLWSVVNQKLNGRAGGGVVDDNSVAAMEEEMTLLSMDSRDPDLMAKKTGLATRLFRSPKRSRTPPPRLNDPKRSVSVSSVGTQSSWRSVASSSLVGRANVFLSSLSSDFLQAMLSSPTESEGTSIPRILADTSGDFAILLDKSSTDSMTTQTEFQRTVIDKRSNLLRLQYSDLSAGYSRAAEFREILYLPARPEKHYDVDSHLSPSRCHVNLLFLYPRLLRLSPSGTSITKKSRFTIRVRILRLETIGGEKTESADLNSQAMKLFHGLAPWIDEELLDSHYTRVIGDFGLSTLEDIEVGLPMRDEIKVQLPDVIDCAYRLQFTLYEAVKSPDNLTNLTHLSEMSIPLTSSSSRDSNFGIRIATIIPNGKHRLELGAYQLHLETRLVSTVHIGDTGVSAVLSDSIKVLQLADNTIFNSPSADGFHMLPQSALASSSESTIAAFFQVLIYDILSIQCGSSTITASDTSLPPFTGVTRRMYLLFTILDKVKSKFRAINALSDRKQNLFHNFTKQFIDLFDDSSSPDDQVLSESTHSEDDKDDLLDQEQTETTQIAFDIVSQEESKGALPASLPRNVAMLQKRGNKEVPLETNELVLSRIAFGASKTDMMRAEAEIRFSSRQRSQFFDDDETIATAPSIHSGPWRTEVKKFISIQTSPESDHHQGETTPALLGNNSIVRSESPLSFLADPSQCSVGDIEFVKRVRNAASVILAPCVAPNVSSVLKTKRTRSPGRITKWNRTAPSGSEKQRNPFVGAVSSVAIDGKQCH